MMPEVCLNKHGRSAAEIIQQINIKNAKVLAFILIVGFIIYHGLLHWRYGKFKQTSYFRNISQVLTMVNSFCSLLLPKNFYYS